MAIKKKIPFAFALEELDALSPAIKPMFGGVIVYIGGKMALFLYDREKLPGFNGVSLATTPEQYRSLAREFSSTRDAEPKKIGERPWLHIPAEAADFEEQVLKACELILNGDPRIGRAPGPKKSDQSPKRAARSENSKAGEKGRSKEAYEPCGSLPEHHDVICTDLRLGGFHVVFWDAEKNAEGSGKQARLHVCSGVDNADDRICACLVLGDLYFH
ncbi:MAG: hypothetical protein J2P21_09865 [Chloracidobacterium sp.]|nr:hypothetical protein [Chloracidobacterium sp.]